MQPKPFHITPTRFLPPAIVPPLAHRLLSPPKPPQAISISAPPTTLPRLTTTDDATDDTTAAFWDYQFLFMSQRTETSDPITLQLIDGAIPPDFPSGTYYLTGPGLFSDDHGSTVHPLDGHGYLRAFNINGVTKEVKFMAKYVKTEAQVEEHDSKTDTWRFSYRGPFSVLKGGKKLGNVKVMKNVANTTVVCWGGKLLCLWEGGDPYEIEFGSLDTIGKVNVIDGCDSPSTGGEFRDLVDVAAGFLKPILHGLFKMPPKRMLSHYKVDVKRNRLITVSCNAEDMLLPKSNFTFYEFDSEFNMVKTQEFDIPDQFMIHDWAVTDTYYILFGNRIKLDPLGSMGAMCGLSPMISALSLNPSKNTSPIYLLPRFPNSGSSEHDRDWRVPVEAPSQLWLIHVGNAFEVKDAAGNSKINIQASACSYQWFNFQKVLGYNWQSGKLDPSIMNVKEEGDRLLPHLIKVSINLDGNGNCEKCDVEHLDEWDKSSDFPLINPSFSGRKNEYIYAATTTGSRKALPHFPFDTVVKVNLSTNSAQTWSTGARRFIGEPIFVAKGTSEDDGYLLVVEYAVSIQMCYLVILDAKRLGEADAFVARLEVPKHLNFPLGFHGFWNPTNELYFV